MNNNPYTVGVVTRLSRSSYYLGRVLNGLAKQSNIKIEWSVVSQIELGYEHQKCLDLATQNGITVIFNQVNNDCGLGAMANRGVKATRSKFIILNDDDDYLETDCLYKMINNFTNDNIVAVASHGAVIFEFTNNIKKLHYVQSPGRKYVDRRKLQHNNLILTNSLLYKRTVFDEIGGYKEDVPLAEDWLFNLDLVEKGLINIYPKVCAHAILRPHPSTINEQNTVVAKQCLHLQMAKQIRKSYGIIGDYQPKSALHTRVWRLIDKLTFRLGGWFLPRF